MLGVPFLHPERWEDTGVAGGALTGPCIETGSLPYVRLNVR